jgi:hypothetical protein
MMIDLKSRRRVLVGLAAAGVAATGGALFWNKHRLAKMVLQGQTQASKLKVVFYVIPDGFATDGYAPGNRLKGLWYPFPDDPPGHDTTEFALNEVSGILAEYKTTSLFLKGLGFNQGNYVGHGSAPHLLRGKGPAGASIDFHFGNAFDDVLNPGQKAILATPHVDSSGVSFNANNQERPRTSQVLTLFDNIFGTTGLRQHSAGPRSAHLFDPVLEDIRALEPNLSGSEKAKLQAHLDAVEQVAQDLENASPAQCDAAAAPLPGNDWGNGQYNGLIPDGEMDAFHQTVATALACNLSRVATIQLARTSTGKSFIAPGTDSMIINLHECAHKRISSPGVSKEEAWRESRRWLMFRFKSFLDELSKHRDPHAPDDSLLDHTLVVLTSELSDGDPEHNFMMPVTFFGGASAISIDNGGGSGRYLNIADQGDLTGEMRQVAMPRLWNTLAAAAGLDSPFSDAPLISKVFRGIG